MRDWGCPEPPTRCAGCKPYKRKDGAAAYCQYDGPYYFVEAAPIDEPTYIVQLYGVLPPRGWIDLLEFLQEKLNDLKSR